MAQPDEAFAELFYPYAGLPFGHAEAYGFAPTCGDMRLATGAPAVVVAAASLHRFRRCAVPRPVPRVTGRDLFIPNTERYSGQCGPNSCSSKLQCNRGARAQAYRLLQRRYPGRQTGRSRPRRRGQAIAQVLTPIFDPQFSGSSFGFRPGRSAHQAVRAARRCIADGLEWVVDIDLDRFFDRVQFDVLMARVARKVEDRRVDDTIVTDEPRECPCPAEPPSGTPRGRVRRAPWHTRRWRQPARWLAIRGRPAPAPRWATLAARAASEGAVLGFGGLLSVTSTVRPGVACPRQRRQPQVPSARCGHVFDWRKSCDIR